MIWSFRDRGTEAVFHGADTRTARRVCPRELWPVAGRKLDQLNRVTHIRELGARAGVAVNPATPLSSLHDILPDLDHVLLMSVNPGFGGQRLVPSVLDKVRELRLQIADRRLAVRIEMDGGVTEDNLHDVVRSGVDIVVAGSAVFGAGDDIERTTRRIVDRLGELAELEQRC